MSAPGTTYGKKAVYLAAANLFIPTIFSLVLIVILQLYVGKSDAYGCRGCECDYTDAPGCVSWYGQSGAMLALFITFWNV